MNNDKYLIAIDLDGTLLNSESKITPITRDYLHGLSKAGHHIVIATGRPLRAAFSYQEELGVKAPIVCYNGALASFPHNHTFPKRARTFNRDIIKNICHDIGEENLGNLMVETEEAVYIRHFDEELNRFFWNDRGQIYYGDPFANLSVDPLTTLFYFQNLNDERKAEISAIVSKYEGYFIRFWHLSGYAEIYTAECTKKEALEYVAKVLNVPHHLTICFGDADNDLEMLAWAHQSFCMLNGGEKAKKTAKKITVDDNNNDGIVSTLKLIFN